MSSKEAATAIKQCQNLTNEQKLQIYALYKQSTAGDNNNPQPSAFSPMKRYKHDAWLKLKNLPTTEAQKQYIHLVAELAPGFTPVTTTMDLPIDAELNRTTSISNSNDITPNITPIPTPQSSPQRRTFDPTLGPDTPTSARRRRRDEEGRLTPTFVRSVDIDDHKAYEIEVLYRRSFEEEENDNDNDNDNDNNQDHQNNKISRVDGIMPADERELMWTVTHRYSDYAKLHNELLQMNFREDDLPSLPPKRWLFNSDPTFISQRMNDLQQYTILLLSVPRIARTRSVREFFQVTEHLQQEKSRQLSPSNMMLSTTTAAATTATTAATATAAAATSSTTTPTTSPTTSPLSTSSSKSSPTIATTPTTFADGNTMTDITGGYKPIALVAIGSDNEIIASTDLTSFKREVFLTLPWRHRNTPLEVRFENDSYLSFAGKNNASRGERCLAIQKRSAAFDTKRTAYGTVMVRVRLRTNRVDHGRNMNGNGNSTTNNVSKIQASLSSSSIGASSDINAHRQLIVLVIGFVVALFLGWVAAKWNAPIATILSVPLLPMCIVLGVVFGDARDQAANIAGSGSGSGGNGSTGGSDADRDYLLSVGVTLVEWLQTATVDSSSSSSNGNGSTAMGGNGNGKGDDGKSGTVDLPEYVDMSGEWIPDASISKTNLEPMTKALGVNWAMRKIVNRLSISTVIIHTPTDFDRYDCMKSKRVGDAKPPFLLDGIRRKVGGDDPLKLDEYVHTKCWSIPEEAVVVVETTIPKSKNGGAILTDRLSLENNGAWLRQYIKVVATGQEPVYVDRILVRTEPGKAKKRERDGKW